LFASDVLKVLYAPHKIFKQITQNPKYWGPILVFIIFLAAQGGFYYALYSQTYYEQTYPDYRTGDALGTWTVNPALWTTAPEGVTKTNDYLDYINNTIYGNSSLQFAVSNSTSMSLALSGINANCGATYYTTLSMRIKQADPQTVPTNATLTLYSGSSSNIYQQDITSSFSNSSLIGGWNNLTFVVGPNATNWQSAGSPQWGSITGITLDFNYASNSTITLRIEGLFFRGIFESPIKTDFGNFIIYILQASIFQFLEEWIIFAALMFIIIKGLKGTVVWKPLFIATGFALVVNVVQALITIAAIPTLPKINYPVEVIVGVPGEAEAILNVVAAQTATFSLFSGVIQLAFYIWTVALGAFIVRALLPEYSNMKCIIVSAAGFIVTIIVINLLSALGI